MKSFFLFSLILFSTLNTSGKGHPGGGAYLDPQIFPAVVKIALSQGYCSATIIGPKTLLTAAHCFRNSTKDGSFVIQKKTYTFQAITFESIFGEFVDQAILYTKEPILNVLPMTLNLTTQPAQRYTVLGWGCSSTDLNMYLLKPSGQNENLYFRELISATRNIQAACGGDSGGPVLIPSFENQKPQYTIVGILCRSNSMDKSDMLKLNHPKNQDFLNFVIKKYQLEICGINKACDFSS